MFAFCGHRVRFTPNRRLPGCPQGSLCTLPVPRPSRRCLPEVQILHAGSVSPIPSATGGFRAENPQICVYRLRTPRWWLCPSAVPSRRNRCSFTSNPWVPRVPWFSLKRFPANLSGVCDKGKFLGITSNVKILMRRRFGGWQKLPSLALEMDLMISAPLLL